MLWPRTLDPCPPRSWMLPYTIYLVEPSEERHAGGALVFFKFGSK